MDTVGEFKRRNLIILKKLKRRILDLRKAERPPIIRTNCCNSDFNLCLNTLISGHSHKPLIEEKNGVLFLNPGSAGRRRFKLPISIAQMKIDGTKIQAEIIELSV